MNCRLVLASQSPRRREILTSAGLDFEIRAGEVSEIRHPHEPVADYVRRLARAKAEAVPRGAGEVVLGADTVVVIGDDVLGKPRDAEDAARMLALLSGREHTVVTGISLVHSGGVECDAAETRVRFAELSTREIAEYVASGEPADKAGGYAIQGLASKFVERVEGCYFNVVGLPVTLVYRLLKALSCDSAK